MLANLALFLGLGYLIMLHLRSELITWRCRSDQISMLNHVESCCLLFKKADRTISRALRLVRDITVIATGHTTVNTGRVIQVHVSAQILNCVFTRLFRQLLLT